MMVQYADLAFIFPGQGSQTQGMLAELFPRYPIIPETFQEASDVLGYALWDLIQNNPNDLLNQTEFTQPAILAASVALWRSWRECFPDKMPILLAGHSLGEYSALVCADALAFSDAVRLVQKRGQLMQQAVNPGEGAMAAVIGISEAEMTKCCETICQELNAGLHGEGYEYILQAANLNAHAQVVIAGHTQAVDKFMQNAKTFGAKLVKKLPVSVPSHCVLMKPAAQKFAESLTNIQFSSPKIPVIHNVDCESHAEPQKIKKLLIEQLYSPVQWVRSVEAMARQGIKQVVECGPGTVLMGLNKRINQEIVANSVFSFL